MAGVAYWILTRTIISVEGKHSLLAKAVGKDRKGKLSILLYAVAIPMAFYNHWTSQALYVVVALMWLVPDQRIEKVLAEQET